MRSKSFIVRLVQPSDKPVLPKADPLPDYQLEGENDIFSKNTKIVAGSTLGFIAGLLIYLMLKSTGVSLGNLESSFIIGMPAFLGIISSLVIC